MNLCLHVNCPVDEMTKEERQLLLALYKNSKVLMNFSYSSDECAEAIASQYREERRKV